MRPESFEYAPFYAGYITLVPEGDLVKTLFDSLNELHSFVEVFNESNANFAYATGKWTMQQVLQHLIDTERIFAFRALCIARGEKQALPGFDENLYADQTLHSMRPICDVKEELILLRRSSYLLFKGFSNEELLNSGSVNNGKVSVRAIGYMMIGHIRHHRNIVIQRYINS